MRHLNKWYPYEKPSGNKSAKHHTLIMGHKNVLRSVSNKQLEEWAYGDVPGAKTELERRHGKADKKN